MQDAVMGELCAEPARNRDEARPEQEAPRDPESHPRLHPAAFGNLILQPPWAVQAPGARPVAGHSLHPKPGGVTTPREEAFGEANPDNRAAQ